MKFDEDRYPDPGSMMKELHEMDVRLMISVWSKIDAQSEVGKQAKEKDITYRAVTGLTFSIRTRRLSIGRISVPDY